MPPLRRSFCLFDLGQETELLVLTQLWATGTTVTVVLESRERNGASRRDAYQFCFSAMSSIARSNTDLLLLGHKVSSPGWEMQVSVSGLDSRCQSGCLAFWKSQRKLHLLTFAARRGCQLSLAHGLFPPSAVPIPASVRLASYHSDCFFWVFLSKYSFEDCSEPVSNIQRLC